MSVNRLLLVGRLGQDPKLGQGKSGKSFCQFSIATDDGWGDNKMTNWHNCVCFGKTADVIGNHFAKGQDIFVEGWVKYEEYEGKKRTTVMVEGFSFIGRKAKDPDDQRNDFDNGDAPF